MAADGTIKINTDLETKEAESAMSKFGNAVKTGMAAVGISFAAAGAATTKFVKDSVMGFAAQEQAMGGVETMFKNSSGKVVEYASDAFKTAGLSSTQYMEQVTSFSARLLQGLGGDTERAADIAHVAIVDMSDNANKFGTNIGSIQDAYQGFAKANFTMLDNLRLGYGGTAGEMARLINDSGVLNGEFVATAENVKDIPFDTMIEAIHRVQDGFGITGTTAREATETISGSIGMLKASFANLVAGAADSSANIKKLAGDVAMSFSAVAQNVLPAVRSVIASVPQILAQLLPMVKPIFAEIAAAAVEMMKMIVAEIARAVPALTPFAAALTFLLNNIESIIPVVMAATAAFLAFQAGMAIGSIINTISTAITVVSGVMQLYAAGATVATVASASFGASATVLGTIMAVLTGKITLAQAAQAVWNVVMAANPIGVVIGLVAAFAAGLAVLVGWLGKGSAEQQKFKADTENLISANERLISSIESSDISFKNNVSGIEANAGAAENLAKKVEALSAVENKSAEEKKKLKVMVDMLNQSMPGLNLAYNEQADLLNMTTSEIYSLIEAEQARLMNQAIQERALELAREQLLLEEQLVAVSEQRAALDLGLEDKTITQWAYNSAIKDLNAEEIILQEQLEATKASFEGYTDQLAETTSAQNEMNQAQDEAVEKYGATEEAIAEVAEAYGTTADAIKAAMDASGQSLDEFVNSQDSMRQAAAEATKDVINNYDALKTDIGKSASEIIGNLSDNAAKTREWAGLMAKHAQYMSDDTLATFKSWGVGSLSYLQEMENTSSTDWSAWNDAFAEAADVGMKTTETNILEAGIENAVGDVIEGAADAVSSNTSVESNTTQLITGARQAVDSSAPQFTSAGYNLSMGLAQGIRNGQSAVINAAISVMKSAVNAAKSAAQIRSPSRVMASVGGYFSIGFADGIEDNASAVVGSATDVTDSAIKAVTDGAKRIYTVMSETSKALKRTAEVDYSALMMEAQSLETFLNLAASRNEKIISEGIDLTAQGYADNAALLERWLDESGYQLSEAERQVIEASGVLADTIKKDVEETVNAFDGLAKAFESALSSLGANDSTIEYDPDVDYSALMLEAKDTEEFLELSAKRNAKIMGENIDLAANGYRDNSTLLSQWAQKTSQNIEQLTSQLQESLGGFQDETQKATGKMLDGVGEKLDELSVSVKEALDKLPPEAEKVGKAIADGLADGIRANINAAVNAAIELAQAVNAAMRDSLEVRSPSRLTRYFGQMFSEGLAIGIDDEADMAASSARSMVDDIKAEMSKLKAAVDYGQARLAAGAAASADRHILTNSSTVTNNNQSGTYSPVQNFYISSELDARAVSRQIAKDTERELRSRGVVLA